MATGAGLRGDGRDGFAHVSQAVRNESKTDTRKDDREQLSIAACVATKILLPVFGLLLRTGDVHSTFDRLLRSRHVRDLQMVAGAVFSFVLVISFMGAWLAIPRGYDFYVQAINTSNASDRPLWSAMRAVHPVVTFIAPAFAVFGVVLAWAYRSGSTRLGIVDLFACEIGTLCRVTTLLDAVRQRILRFGEHSAAEPAADKPHSPAEQQFSSQEHYFPVFENCAKDLQALEAKVVANITAFYTYMKAVRDSGRSLAALNGHADQGTRQAGAEASRHDRELNLIYLMFLALESGRMSLNQLVEYEPDHAERVIVVLISELEAYGYLRHEVQESDFRRERLELRLAGYQHETPKLWRNVVDERSRRDGWLWEPAALLLPTLEARYEAAGCGRLPEQAKQLQ